ncbi:MAG TPA: hypothetical protein VFM82_12230 [Flavobacteriaceae bacterium]|nr:hypothetical protein [Flavobacteriaceae bacterium]
MKAIITSFLMIVCFSGFSQEELKLKGVTMENDHHKGISWVKSKEVRLNKDGVWSGSSSDCNMQLYFGIKEIDGKAFLTPIKLQSLFWGDEWVFFDEISFLFGTPKEIRDWKGTKFTLETSGKRSVGNGISEESTVNIEGESKNLIKYILENEPTNLNVRFANTDRNEYVEFDVSKKTVEKLQKHFKALVDSYNRVSKFYTLNQSF